MMSGSQRQWIVRSVGMNLKYSPLNGISAEHVVWTVNQDSTRRRGLLLEKITLRGNQRFRRNVAGAKVCLKFVHHVSIDSTFVVIRVAPTGGRNGPLVKVHQSGMVEKRRLAVNTARRNLR
jgi:hypothetical protein